MSSPNTDTNTAAPSSPRVSSSTAPPPYTSSDAQSVASGKSTTKSILDKILNRKSSDGPSSRKIKTQKEIDEDEAKHAARAAYFATH